MLDGLNPIGQYTNAPGRDQMPQVHSPSTG